MTKLNENQFYSLWGLFTGTYMSQETLEKVNISGEY